jgi:hypothetical protein
MQVEKGLTPDGIEMIRRMMGHHRGNVRNVRTHIGEMPVGFPEQKDGKKRRAFAVKSLTYNKKGKFDQEWVALTEEEAGMLKLQWDNGKEILDEMA